MEETRIAKFRIDEELKKLFERELECVMELIMDQGDILTFMGNNRMPVEVVKGLIIDFLIDYKDALMNEIKELKEKLYGE